MNQNTEHHSTTKKKQLRIHFIPPETSRQRDSPSIVSNSVKPSRMRIFGDAVEKPFAPVRYDSASASAASRTSRSMTRSHFDTSLSRSASSAFIFSSAAFG